MTVLDLQARILEIRAMMGLATPQPTGSGAEFAATLQSTLAGTSAVTGADVVSAAGKYLGTPYETPTAIRRVLPSAHTPSPSPLSPFSSPLSPAPLSPTPPSPLLAAAPALRPAALAGNVPFADLFQRAGSKYGLSPTLLAAVAKVESGYNPRAVSSAGAQGLMQLMPGTARGLGVDALDPRQAVDGAARMLAGSLQQFGSIELALAAYNAGGGAVRRYGGVPPFAQTQAYIPKVKAAMDQLADRGFA